MGTFLKHMISKMELGSWKVLRFRSGWGQQITKILVDPKQIFLTIVLKKRNGHQHGGILVNIFEILHSFG